MKLFFYYALHSVKNQIRKLFKTWVFILIIACFLLGIVCGVIGAVIGDAVDSGDDSEDYSEFYPGDETGSAEDGSDIYPGFSEDGYKDVGESEEENTGPNLKLAELIISGIALGMFTLMLLTAEKSGSKLFLPADVNLLFASPLKPQAVLLFRLLTQIGMLLLLSIFYISYIPMLSDGLGLSIAGSITFIIAWFMILAFSSILQLSVYIMSSKYPKFRKAFTPTVYGILALVAAGYIFTVMSSGKNALESAYDYFCAPLSRYIPVWGWIKGFTMFASEGNMAASVISLAGVIAAGALIVFFIWKIDADFYEEAMAKSEETAELIAKMQSEKSGGVALFKKREIDREDSLLRDGMRYGRGANVFFFKTLYNRFRFAKSGFITKTLVTYTAAAVLVSAVSRFALGYKSCIPAALVIAALTFYRSLGNPLETDTQNDFFVLIPESSWSKLFWSLMGGTACCLLDAFPAIVIGGVVSGDNVLVALAWLPLILSIDFYATNVGAFINLSVPVSAGKNIKQVVQILFIYFGIVPDIAIIAVGFALEHLSLCVLIAAVLNIAIGMIFLGLTPLFIDPCGGTQVKNKSERYIDIKKAGKVFSTVGITVLMYFLIDLAAQYILGIVFSYINPAWMDSYPMMCIYIFVPQYLLAFPCALLILRTLEPSKPEKSPLKFSSFILMFIISEFFMYAGNVLGNLLNSAIMKLAGISGQSLIENMILDWPLYLKLALFVIIGPFFEEFLFRKTIIDRTRVYGEKNAVIFSAVMFGLFHGNIIQLFYAAGIGLVLGYVYTKTGKLRYSYMLHVIINFFGSIVSAWIIDYGAEDLEKLESTGEIVMSGGVIAYFCYIACIIAVSLAGMVLFFVKKRNVSFRDTELELPKEKCFRVSYVNVGVILFAVGSIVMMGITILNTLIM